MFIQYHTKNFGDTAARIKKLVAVFDKFWYLDIKKEFQKRCVAGEDYYDAGPSEEEYEKYLQTIINPEEREYLSEQDYHIPILFEQFCYDIRYSKSRFNGEDACNTIIKTTLSITSDAGATDYYQLFKFFVEKVKTWVEEEINDRLEYWKDPEYASLLKGFLKKWLWQIDYKLNDKLKALELSQSFGQPVISINVPEKVYIHQFSTDNLMEILLPDAIPFFIEIEKRLIAEGYFDNGKWDKTLDECASLIKKLWDNGYCRPVKKGKERHIAKIIKPFFERRYNIEFTKQLQRAYRNSSRLNGYLNWMTHI